MSFTVLVLKRSIFLNLLTNSITIPVSSRMMPILPAIVPYFVVKALPTMY